MAVRGLAALSVIAVGSAACASAPRWHVPIVVARNDPAVAAALNWLELLKANDADTLLEVSQLPLTVTERSLVLASCDSMVADTTRLERLIGCLRLHQPHFFDRFGADDKTKVEPVDRAQLAFGGRPRAGERLVRAIVDDTGGRAEMMYRSEVVLVLVPGAKEWRPLVATVSFKETIVVH